MTYLRIILTAIFICALMPEISAEESSSPNFMPEIHGVVRSRWEMNTSNGESRFQVRNARLSARGDVMPIAGYFVNVDFCDRGKIIILDAYGRISPTKAIDIKAGQFRLPFGSDSFRGPGNYYFNNRSFIGKTVNNIRGVGVAVSYRLPFLPATLEAGIFNPTGIDDHNRWTKKYAYATKLTFRSNGFILTPGFESLIPEQTRINMAGIAAGWGNNTWYAEAEYMYRHYAGSVHKATNAYNIFVSYAIPLPHSIFDDISFQTRFDGMTDLWTGKNSTEYAYATDVAACRRLTIGSTLDYRYKSVRSAIRLNFEKKFYHKQNVDANADDRLSVELIIKF